MDCPDCERIDDILFPETIVWMWPPTGDSHSKLVALLHDEGFEPTPFGAAGLRIDLPVDAAHRFAIVMMGGLSGEELGALKLITTQALEIRPEDLARSSSGAAFVARIDAQWLVSCLKAERYESWFQPIFDRDGRRFADEALFRLREEDGAIVSPARAFSSAKAAGLLFNLDLISRRSAVETAARARLPGKLFINFNPSSVYDPAYCLRTTASTIATLGLRPEDIVFEVTESEQARDMRHLKGILAFYRNAGFRVALDDVGSGYSSLNMLSEVRPDYMKIDMELIRDVDEDRYKQAILRNLFAIAKDNGIRTVAEGIETEDEKAWLLENGADLMQGYLFARPAPAETSAVPAAAE